MTDLERILPLWRELETSGADYVLATVVAVEGSSYRKPGARMLLAQDGRRAGTVSGGCLEAEVAQRAWWLTSNGPVIERYSTAEEDGERPYGSGCGGVVFLLLERRATAGQLLRALEAAFSQRTPLAIATILEGPQIGHRSFAGLSQSASDFSSSTGDLSALAQQSFERRSSMERNISIGSVITRAWADYRPARPGLWIFGAGDDAKPLLHLAREMGWFVAVADGRSHLATRDRFIEADEVRILPIADLPDAAAAHLDLHPSDAAVLMTHSFDQDSHILASLLGDSLDFPLAYLGVLGPQRRTREVLAEAAHLRNLPSTADRAERWLEQMHAPTGLDLGAETPATIALSILAEIQKVLAAASAQPLRQVRADRVAVTRS
ncbi:MAG TPA: XdhC family protein [Terracidiphilus sp.]|nr:XdhC family protein [Terracidiphilus sp.]